MAFAAGELETVSVLRPPPNDAFGDPQPGTTLETVVPGCLVAPGGSSEFLDAANQVSIDMTVYAPAGTDIVATDRMRVRGAVFQVIGAPQSWGAAGMSVPLHRVTG